MNRWRPKSAANATRASTSPSVRKWAYASGVGRCIPPAALQLERQSRVVRRLIAPRKGRQRRTCGFDVGIGQFEAVEAAARHEKQLVAPYVAGGTQLAGESPLFAQLARLGIAASLAGSGKLRRNQGKSRGGGRQRFPPVSRLQNDTQPAAARNPRVALALPLREREDQRRRRNVRGFTRVRPRVLDDSAVTQQSARHTPSP